MLPPTPLAVHRLPTPSPSTPAHTHLLLLCASPPFHTEPDWGYALSQPAQASSSIIILVTLGRAEPVKDSSPPSTALRGFRTPRRHTVNADRHLHTAAAGPAILSPQPSTRRSLDLRGSMYTIHYALRTIGKTAFFGCARALCPEFGPALQVPQHVTHPGPNRISPPKSHSHSESGIVLLENLEKSRGQPPPPF